jgi:4-hydroxyphenylacetate 3-monooxygenase
MEIKGERWGATSSPTATWFILALALTQQLYPTIMTTLRELAGGSRIMLPSGVADPPPPRLPITCCGRRARFRRHWSVKLFKLVWDAVGSEFASRHTQYKCPMPAQACHQGAPFRTYDWRSTTLWIGFWMDTTNGGNHAR